MADEDWGTVSIKPKKRSGRDVDALRERYANQRDILGQLAADAPSEHLASEYVRVKEEVETALARLDALETADSTQIGAPDGGRLPAGPTTGRPTWSAAEVREAGSVPGALHAGTSPSPVVSEDRTRLFLIPFVGLILLLLLGYFVWRSFSHRNDAESRIVEQTIAASPSGASDPIERAAPEPATVAELRITPPSQEFGSIRKGTRAARQYELVNRTGGAIAFKVTRSACRCIYYEYVDHLAIDGKGTLTVTVDGSRAKTGELRESIDITGKADKKPLGSFEVVAAIQ